MSRKSNIMNFHIMIKSCYARFHKYKEDVHAKKNHATENHVRRGIAVLQLLNYL